MDLLKICRSELRKAEAELEIEKASLISKSSILIIKPGIKIMRSGNLLIRSVRAACFLSHFFHGSSAAGNFCGDVKMHDALLCGRLPFRARKFQGWKVKRERVCC